MFKKVLVAEDFDSINIAVNQTLNTLAINEIHHAKYCDDALLKIKKALQENEPYELLISDLSFKTDHRKVTLASGEDLIEKVREIQPNIKVIVYSIEDKNFRVKALFHNFCVDGYVHKGRKSITELKTAIKTILNEDKTYISPDFAHILQDKVIHEIDNFDIQLIKQLASGVAQDQIETKFKELGITPNSKSTIEKRLGKLKDYFKANNTVHLIAIAKDLGIA
jgi:two-component system, NarL family, captular synthesis response regulator RcsB